MDTIEGDVENDVVATLPLEYTADKIEKNIEMNPDGSSLIKKGDKIGTVSYSYAGNEIAQADITAKTDSTIESEALTEAKLPVNFKLVGIILAIIAVIAIISHITVKKIKKMRRRKIRRQRRRMREAEEKR